MSRSLHLVHLYPQEMNIYGDTGNRLIIKQRLQWRGFEVKISFVGMDRKLPTDADIILGGGAQDAVQQAVEKDLVSKKVDLIKMANDGVVMLMVCGMYQLFGHEFVPHEGETIRGIGVLDVKTKAGPTRFIGNTIYETPWGEVVGYENHSGLTTMAEKAQALGMVIKGAGNNGHDKTEGCIYKNVFGTYSHGPVLSKNPLLVDELLKRALERKYGQGPLEPLNDELENTAAKIAKQRPR